MARVFIWAIRQSARSTTSVKLPLRSDAMRFSSRAVRFINLLKSVLANFAMHWCHMANRHLAILPITSVRICLRWRSEEHTSELQSLMRISYAVFCLKQQTKHLTYNHRASNTPPQKKLHNTK